MNFTKVVFSGFQINSNQLFKTSSTPRATASEQKIEIFMYCFCGFLNKVIKLKKTIQNIVITTVEFSVDNTE